MSDVLLVSCPISFSKKKGEFLGDETTNPPLGLMYIAACLEREGLSVRLCDVTAEELGLEGLLEEIAKESPKVVGIAVLTSGVKSAVEFAQAFKERFGGKIQLGIGGPHITADPGFFERFPLFDFAVLGEGEITFTRLAKKMLSGEKIQGVFSGEPVEDLDSLPFPARHLIDTRNYGPPGRKWSKEDAKNSMYASILGSRGCPFNCIYCSKIYGKKVRFRSGKNIADEVAQLFNDYGGKFVFMDDTFTLNRKNVEDFCSEIISRSLRPKWMAMTRANLVDEKILQLMKNAGCTDLFFGVEAGSERVRNEIVKKSISDDSVLKAIRLCRKFGIQSSVFLMIGFPTETLKELDETVRFAGKSGADLIGVHLTVPLPGSELFESAIKDGIISPGIIDSYARGELGDGFRNSWPVYVPKGLSMKDLEDARKKAYRSFFMSPSWIMRRIARDFTSFKALKEDIGMLGVGLHVLLKGSTPTAYS